MDEISKEKWKEFLNKCNNLKQKAQKELDKKLSDFKITDCNKLWNDLALTQICEFKIAIEKWCEILKDETKIKKCSEYKDLIQQQNIIKSIEDFDLKNYIN